MVVENKALKVVYTEREGYFEVYEVGQVGDTIRGPSPIIAVEIYPNQQRAYVKHENGVERNVNLAKAESYESYYPNLVVGRVKE